MHVYAAVASVVAALCVRVSASPLVACENDGANAFVADDRSLCIFYQCVFGRAAERACAKGSRVPSHFTKSVSFPCAVKIKENVLVACSRYNVTDDPIPDAKNSDLCALFRPCDSRPGCTCVDQMAGYYCNCPSGNIVAPTPARTPVPLCDFNVCQNGGSCYMLYKNKFCNCQPPYTGKYCETDACDSMECKNGECVFGNFGVYCQCMPCYTGQQCEDEISNCTSHCHECLTGLNCTTPRSDLCKCNPCGVENYFCYDGVFGRRSRTCFEDRSVVADFTLMFEDNTSDPPLGLDVYVSAASDDGIPRFVTISGPLTTYRESAVIEPGTVHKFSVNVSLKHTTTGKANFGVRVRERHGSDLNVYCVNRAYFSADGWLAIPDRVAGMKFIVISYPPFLPASIVPPILSASQFAIVAIHNNTVLSIYLANGSEDIPNSDSNTTVLVYLNAWQTYQVKSARNDLTGTLVVSSKPIHVYSGASRTWVGPSRTNPDYDPNYPDNLKSRDHLVVECTSIDTWGKTHALVPLPRATFGYLRTEEAVRVVSSRASSCKLYATTDDILHFTETTITLSSEQHYFANFFIDAEYNYFLSCDQPVMLVEITLSAMLKYSLHNDASFIYVPPVYSYSSYYLFIPPLFSVTNSPYSYTYLRLIATEAAYLGIELNHERLVSMSVEAMKNWTRIYVPNAGSSEDFPALYGCIVRISSSNITSVAHPFRDAKFSAVVEGFDNRESYGIALGRSIRSRNSF